MVLCLLRKRSWCIDQQFASTGHVILKWRCKMGSCIIIGKMSLKVCHFWAYLFFFSLKNEVLQACHNSAQVGNVGVEKNWDEHLPLLTAAYRNIVHSVTGFTPNPLMLGREDFQPHVIWLRTAEVPGELKVHLSLSRNKLTCSRLIKWRAELTLCSDLPEEGLWLTNQREILSSRWSCVSEGW